MFSPLSNNEKKFVITNLIDNFREDSRKMNEYRNIKLTKLKENGQIQLEMGNTLIITQVFAKLINATSDRPNEGVIVFSIDTNHLRSNAEFNQSNEELSDLRNKISNLLEKTLRDSRALDVQALCVIPGKMVWKIVIDINIVNHDGNVFDGCVLGAIASYCSFKIPFLRKQGDRIEIPEKPQLINLSTLHLPLSATFGLFNENKNFLVDPSLKEERVCEGYVIISANKFNELCYIHTFSAIKVDREIVDEILTESREKILHLYKTLKNFLASLEPKKRLVTNTKHQQRDEEKNTDKDNMEIDDGHNVDLEQMQKTFKKGVSANKNKLNMFEIK